MSYILDALQRAKLERDRERGQVPGLYAQTTDARFAAAPPRPRLSPLIGLGLVVAAIACGLLAWRLLRPAAPVGAGAADPSLAAAPIVAAPVATAPAATVATPPAAGVLTKPAPTLAPPAPAPTGVSSGAASANAVPVGTTTAGPAVAPLNAATPGAPVTPLASTRPLTVVELPADVRAQLPALAISGATYSSNPAHRMLIINGQVFQEGDKPTPDITVELIQPKSVVLAFRGYRYLVNY